MQDHSNSHIQMSLSTREEDRQTGYVQSAACSGQTQEKGGPVNLSQTWLASLRQRRAQMPTSVRQTTATAPAYPEEKEVGKKRGVRQSAIMICTHTKRR